MLSKKNQKTMTLRNIKRSKSPTPKKDFGSWQLLNQETISQEYSQLLSQMHDNRPNFGTFCDTSEVNKWIEKYKIRSVIDYGCGKGAMVFNLKKKYPDKEIYGYDPGHPDFSIPPSKKYDMLFTTDVMEHIEPRYLSSVLEHINDLFTNIGYFYIATSPAKKKLPDGRNAHLIVEGPDFWREKIQKKIDGKIIWEDIVERSFTSKGNFGEVKLFGNYKMKKNKKFEANKYYALVKKQT